MDARPLIDPEIAAGMALLPLDGVDFGTWTLETVPDLREFMAQMPAPPAPPAEVEAFTVAVPDDTGRSDCSVRVFRPAGAPSGLPLVLWMHGGGFMFGSGLIDDPRCVKWATAMPCVVVSVEYRSSPEHAFPAALEDCYAALRWAAGDPGLAVDRSRVAVTGASAGGNLAAALALLARERGEIDLCFQMLIYPMIDDRNVTPSSHLEHAPIWSRNANLLAWRAYLGYDPGGTDVPANAAPTRALDLRGLPPAFVAAGGVDVFRDENIDYASRLYAAGVPTELHVYPGAPHGFEVVVPDAEISLRCEADLDAALARALAR